jgi:hypothetical protein
VQFTAPNSTESSVFETPISGNVVRRGPSHDTRELVNIARRENSQSVDSILRSNLRADPVFSPLISQIEKDRREMVARHKKAIEAYDPAIEHAREELLKELEAVGKLNEVEQARSPLYKAIRNLGLMWLLGDVEAPRKPMHPNAPKKPVPVDNQWRM